MACPTVHFPSDKLLQDHIETDIPRNDDHDVGAGLDVTAIEPLPAGHPLWSMPNVLLTPHIAGGTIEAARRTIQASYANILRVHTGESPLNVA